ncbi:hypothetical protein BGZ60DRAFT_417089 [Tricladium varicosporioides]|nr:hypothetical protein BGZ60DRAFT_417089 [Hymenoscyphus varicosporioides]
MRNVREPILAPAEPQFPQCRPHRALHLTQNYQATNRRRPADLSTSLDYLINSDTDAVNADLCSACRWEWHYKEPACPKYWSI